MPRRPKSDPRSGWSQARPGKEGVHTHAEDHVPLEDHDHPVEALVPHLLTSLVDRYNVCHARRARQLAERLEVVESDSRVETSNACEETCEFFDNINSRMKTDCCPSR